LTLGTVGFILTELVLVSSFADGSISNGKSIIYYGGPHCPSIASFQGSEFFYRSRNSAEILDEIKSKLDINYS